MGKITLKSIAGISFTEMGKCMCKTNCSAKIADNTVLVKEIRQMYQAPSLEEISEIPFTEMGKCMCKTNCSKSITDNGEVVKETSKVYKKEFKDAA